LTAADAPVPDCATAGALEECAALLAELRADGRALPVAVLADDWSEAEVLPVEDCAAEDWADEDWADEDWADEDWAGSTPILAWSGPPLTEVVVTGWLLMVRPPDRKGSIA
jgi:hypothetical protein